MKPWREWLEVVPSAAHSAPISSCRHYAYRQILFPEQVSVQVLRMCNPLLTSAEVKQKLGVSWAFMACCGMKLPFYWCVCVCVCVCVCLVGITTETSADVTWSFHAFPHFLQRSAESRIRHDYFLPFSFQFIVPKSGLHLALGWADLLKNFVKWSKNECLVARNVGCLVTSHFPNTWPCLPPHPLTDRCLFDRSTLHAEESKSKANLPVEELESLHCNS